MYEEEENKKPTSTVGRTKSQFIIQGRSGLEKSHYLIVAIIFRITFLKEMEVALCVYKSLRLVLG